MISACFYRRFLHLSSVNCRYKQKWVEMGRKKVMPRELALSFFDTYYPLIYGEKNWESMRHALLRVKKKHCALLNNHSDTRKTIEDMVDKHDAHDIMMITGRHIYHDSSLNSGESSILPSAAATDSDMKTESQQLVVDMEQVGLKEIKYVETPEGFMVPTRDNPEESRPYTPPDLYNFEPASRRLTYKEQLENDISTQTHTHTPSMEIEILPPDPLLLPPMLKCYIHRNNVHKFFPSPSQDSSKLLSYYLMDAGSILPVLALGLTPNDEVLDLCSAPGGKSLAVLQTLLVDMLVCVDSSWSRLKRLSDTLQWYIPGVFDNQSAIQRVILHNGDGIEYADKNRAKFDKVIVDVPCNTDRTVVHEDENSLFKRTRVTERLHLPELQANLLIAGITACKPGGSVVYSTCTLTPGQNDHVVEDAITRLHTDTNIRVAVQNTSNLAQRLGHVFKFWPHSTYGQLVLPSSEANFGPTYFCKLIRLK